MNSFPSSFTPMFNPALSVFKILSFVLLILLGVSALTLRAEPPGIEQSSDLYTDPAGDKFLRWHGHAGRSYFLQVADPNNPLAEWFWAPIIEAGNDVEISYEVDGTASKGFFRLKHTDQPVPPGETLETADFDEDGLPNIMEIDPPGIFGQTDPLNSDTDGDGLPDGWETVHFLDPNDPADASQTFPGSALTNVEACQAGVQAVPNATMENKDGDALDGDLDAAPHDAVIDWERPAADRFAVIPMPNTLFGLTTPTGFDFLELLDNFDVLVSGEGYGGISTSRLNGFWKLGEASFAEIAMPSVSYTDPLWGPLVRKATGAVGMAGDSILYKAAAVEGIDYKWGGAILAPPGGAAVSLWKEFAADGTSAYAIDAIGGDRSGRAIAYIGEMYGVDDEERTQYWSMTAASGVASIEMIHSEPAPPRPPPPLTVWRKLWVENDSMKAIPTDTFGYKRNDLSWNIATPRVLDSFSNTLGGATFIISAITDTTNFENLENGRIIVQSQTLPITDAVIFGTGAFGVDVDGDHTNVPVHSGFRLYDDDDFGLLTPPLPNLTLAEEKVDDKEVMKDVFRPAFIEIVSAAAYNARPNLDFLPNAWITTFNDSIFDDNIDVPDSNDLWAVTVVAAYQGKLDADLDPHSEDASEGVTPPIGATFSVVWVETLREYNDLFLRGVTADMQALNDQIRKDIILTAAHEIGHHPEYHRGNDHHGESALMGSGGYQDGDAFLPLSILRFRKTFKWTQY